MLISFAGCDGAGKSTQVKNVANWLSLKGFEVEILDKWDILDVSKFPECRFLKDDLDDLRVCIAEMDGISRAMFLFWSISITLTKNDLTSNKKVYLLDGYWMKHAASEIIYGCPENWILNTVEQLPNSDLTFYFNVPPNIALSRKKDLTPYECGRDPQCSESNFMEHQSKLNHKMNEWADKYKWEIISSDQDESIIFNELISKIEKILK
ncbi:hypothetical protein PDM87_26870 [Bacillus cereus]|nr:hypothetical protein [Bacillus cereus]